MIFKEPTSKPSNAVHPTVRNREILRRFFVDEKENKLIQKRMQEANIKNFSTFARFMLVNGQIKQVDFSELTSLKKEVNKIGVNINQIVKVVNTNDEVSLEELQLILNELKNLNELVMIHLKEMERSK